MDVKNLYKAQWVQVQTLANLFWSRWRQEYLQTIQSRRKWLHGSTNIVEGDIVLLKDKAVHRNEWSTAIVVKSIPSKDGKVRKVEVRTVKEGNVAKYVRPVTDVVLLLSKKD